MSKKIHLSHWAEAEKERIDRFVDYWVQNADESQGNVPFNMPAGDWDEQYWIWDDKSGDNS